MSELFGSRFQQVSFTTFQVSTEREPLKLAWRNVWGHQWEPIATFHCVLHKVLLPFYFSGWQDRAWCARWPRLSSAGASWSGAEFRLLGPLSWRTSGSIEGYEISLVFLKLYGFLVVRVIVSPKASLWLQVERVSSFFNECIRCFIYCNSMKTLAIENRSALLFLCTPN